MNRRNFLDTALSAIVTTGTIGLGGTMAWPQILGPLYEDFTQQAHPEITADCSPNPYDVRPLVSTIMNSANFILARIPNDVPLVIVMGETHTAPSHTIARMALLKTLKNQFQENSERRFAYGIEATLQKADREFFKDSPSTPEAIYLSNMSSDFTLSYDAPHTSRNAAKFLRAEEIDIQLNDINNVPNEEIFGTIIDQDDPEALALIRRHAPELEGQRIIRSSNLHGVNPTGIMLSNRMMVQKASAHIERSQAKVYVQHCGSAHALGMRNIPSFSDPELPFNESLTHYFQEAGYAVLTVLPEDLNVPNDAMPSMPRTVLAKGLDQTKAGETDETTLLETLQTNSHFRLTA